MTTNKSTLHGAWTSYKQYALKTSIHFLNVIFLICGIILISTGSVMSIKYQEWVSFTQNMAGSVPMLVVFCGIFMLVISFVGCCGSIKESPCLIMFYGILLSVVFFMQLVAGIMAYARRDDIHEAVHASARQAVLQYRILKIMTKKDRFFYLYFFHFQRFHDPTNIKSTHPVSLLQTKLKCCGINFQGTSEWQNKNSTWWKTTVSDQATCFNNCIHVPDTCCKTVSKNCGIDLKNSTTDLEKIWSDGCIHNLSYETLDQVVTIAGAAIVICLVELSGILLSGCFWKQIHGSKYDTF